MKERLILLPLMLALGVALLMFKTERHVYLALSVALGLFVGGSVIVFSVSRSIKKDKGL